MRSSLILGLSLMVAVVAEPPTQASAQSIPSPYRYIEAKVESGPFVGYVSANTGRFGYGPGGGLLLGGRWGIELSGPISFETTVGVNPGSRDVMDPRRELGDQKVGEADVLMSTIDGRLKFSFVGRRTWHGVNPFLVFGGGVAFDLASDDAADDILEAEDRFDFGTSFYGTAGTGVRWWLSDRFTLRGDALFQLWQIDTPPGFAAPERGFTGVEESEWVRGFRLSLAALIRW
jgi:hypothetical protein